MGLRGKLIGQIEIRAVGDLFHESWAYKPHSLCDMCKNVHGFKLLEGDLGTVGSRVWWEYTHDGKRRTAIEILENIDEENKSLTLKVIEGDLMEIYKSFAFTYHVDDTGADKHLVTWTFEYEKLKEDVPDPTTLLDYFLDLTRDMENHHCNTKGMTIN